MKILLGFILLSTIAFGQNDRKISGIVGNGVTYTYQYVDITNDIPLTELDTIQSEFEVVISETNKYIGLSSIKNIDSSFHFDTMIVENLMESELLVEMLETGHYKERREIEFEVNFIDEIVKGAYCPLQVKWMYDDRWNSMKLFATFTHNGKNHIYNFYFDEVTYIGWEHGLMYSKVFIIDEYGETDARWENEVDVFKASDEGTLVVNDTALYITTEKITLEKNFTRCFSSSEKDMYMVNGALISIPRIGRWIFYSFDFNRETRSFDGFYFLGIKEDE